MVGIPAIQWLGTVRNTMVDRCNGSPKKGLLKCLYYRGTRLPQSELFLRGGRVLNSSSNGASRNVDRFFPLLFRRCFFVILSGVFMRDQR